MSFSKLKDQTCNHGKIMSKCYSIECEERIELIKDAEEIHEELMIKYLTEWSANYIKKEDVKNAIDEKHYPKDIFPEVTNDELKKIHRFCVDKLGFPLDRLSAHITRLMYKELKQELFGQHKCPNLKEHDSHCGCGDVK